MKDAEKIIGAGDPAKRKAHDFYPTPPEVTYALLELILNKLACNGCKVVGFGEYLAGIEFAAKIKGCAVIAVAESDSHEFHSALRALECFFIRLNEH